MLNWTGPFKSFTSAEGRSMSFELFRLAAQTPFAPQNPAANFAAIERDLTAKLARPADAILVIESARQGWSLAANSRGIIAVLIGIQSPRTAVSLYGGRPPYLSPNGFLGDTGTHEVGH